MNLNTKNPHKIFIKFNSIMFKNQKRNELILKEEIKWSLFSDSIIVSVYRKPQGIYKKKKKKKESPVLGAFSVLRIQKVFVQ